MNRYGMAVEKDANCFNNCSIPFSDYRRVFPIPLAEMNNNTSGGFMQNPDY